MSEDARINVNGGYQTYQSLSDPVGEKDAHLAFQTGDVNASRAFHAKKKTEPHANSAATEHLKAFVYGGLDGIITTFATVTSVAGAELAPSVVLILGISHLFADGLSMGLGDYLSTQAEIDHTKAEYEREKWEMTHNPEDEKEEMVEIYMQKGVSEEDARLIIETLSKYEDFFLDHMMVEELGLLPVDEDDNPFVGGIVTFLSFVLFGSVPLVSYLLNLIPGVGMNSSQVLWLAVVLTVLTLFGLGAIKGYVIDINKAWWKSGVVMAANGSGAAFVGYLMGLAMKDYLPPGLA